MVRKVPIESLLHLAAYTGILIPGDFSLHIYPVELEDDGVYQCQASPTNDGQPALRSRFARLSVLVPPEPPKILQGDFLVTTEDRELVIECVSVAGKPPAEVTLKYVIRDDDGGGGGGGGDDISPFHNYRSSPYVGDELECKGCLQGNASIHSDDNTCSFSLTWRNGSLTEFGSSLNKPEPPAAVPPPLPPLPPVATPLPAAATPPLPPSPPLHHH
ncbi:irregular chiasm C-roughest protein-like isoform X5 [Vespula maculifrons]|uniref:Irregular chiasm C-roughest protein-like isoform X5 n=1 Tax=Vespula maculifrons TaxID=7453 RepID=A0ABD2BCZ2_VESMC